MTRAALAEAMGGNACTLSRALQRVKENCALVGDARVGSATGYTLPGETRLVTQSTAVRAPLVEAKVEARVADAGERLSEEQARRAAGSV